MMPLAELSAARLAVYAAPAIPLAMLVLPVYIVLPSFYAGAMGIGLATVGTVLLAARIVDAVTDPLIGWLSDRIETRWGRRRPWLLAGLPLTLVAVWQLMVPPAGAGVAHLLLWSVALYLGWTMMIVPLTAWGAELSTDYAGRTRIAAAREVAIVLGTLLALGLPVALGVGGAGQEGGALGILAMAVMVTLPLTVVMAVLWVREPPARMVAPSDVGDRWGVQELRRNGPFRRLVLAYLLNGIANGLPATLFLPFVGQALGAPTAAGPLLFLYFLCGIASVPVWVRLSGRFGKHRTWSVAMVAACIAFAPVPLISVGDLSLFVAVCVVTGLLLGADLVLPSAIQADVVDLGTMRSGQARTALYFSLWSLATKAAAAMAVGVAFPILDMSGFRIEGDNDPHALLVLGLLYAALPVVFKLLAVGLMWNFPLDARLQAAIRRRIARRFRSANRD